MITMAEIASEESDLETICTDGSAARTGKRIQMIRTACGMSRNELGRLVGLDCNRIQHYENGRRKPKLPLIKKIAEALGVEPAALVEPNIETCVGVMHALFRMESLFHLNVVKDADGGYSLRFGDGRNGRINEYLQRWHEARMKLEGRLFKRDYDDIEEIILEYNMFEWKFPHENEEEGSCR